MKAVLMPALGVAMTEGLVLRWLRQPGDSVAEGEPIVEIETDKAAVEVPSPASGIVGPLLAAEGDVVPTGVALTHVSDGTEDRMATLDAPAKDAPAPASPRPSPMDGAAAVAAAGEVAPGVRAPHGSSPRERRLAREQAAAAALQATEADDRQASAPGPARTGGYRGLIAARVVESWTTIPHFSVMREVDATAMGRVRAGYGPTERPSFTDLMLRALALALRETGEGGGVDVGLAVATPNGVVIPVLRGVLDLDLVALRGEREAAVARAREDRLRPDDLRDQPRSTLSNLGTLGVDAFTGVIAVGQLSLLTVGRIVPRPYARDGTLAIRDSFHATLNVDHRSLDGEDAARLLVAFVAAVEDVVSLGDAAAPA